MPKKKRSTWGSKRERGHNTWELRWTANGEPDSETFYGTEKEADDRLAILRIKHLRIVDDTLTINEFFHGVLVPECERRIEDGDFAQQTLDGYISKFGTYIEKRFGDTRLEALKGADVQAWLSEMTAGAAKQAKALLKLIMRRAEDLDYIEYHPMNKRYIMPTKMTEHRRTSDIHNKQELIQIADACRDEWWEAAYILAAFGGALPSEATGIKPDEVRFVKKDSGLYAIAPINHTAHDKKGGGVNLSSRAKNRYRQADIIVMPPFSGRLRAAVRRAIANGEEWLFDDGFGAPVAPSRVSAAFKAWVSRTTFRFIPFGNLRNAYSTMMHAHGLSDDTVQKLMRHASKSNTDYEHYNRPSAEEFMVLMEDAFDELWAEKPLTYGQNGQTCP